MEGGRKHRDHSAVSSGLFNVSTWLYNPLDIISSRWRQWTWANKGANLCACCVKSFFFISGNYFSLYSPRLSELECWIQVFAYIPHWMDGIFRWSEPFPLAVFPSTVSSFPVRSAESKLIREPSKNSFSPLPAEASGGQMEIVVWPPVRFGFHVTEWVKISSTEKNVMHGLAFYHYSQTCSKP